jgi:hypothetical protein
MRNEVRPSSNAALLWTIWQALQRALKGMPSELLQSFLQREGERCSVRSEGPGGEKRFIEVKGRAKSRAIVLTGSEVDKLRQLGGRAWLFVVTFCKPGLGGVEVGERPRLRIIQDPISRLNPEMLYRQIQYLVEEGDWAQQGEEVDAPSKTEERGT